MVKMVVISRYALLAAAAIFAMVVAAQIYKWVDEKGVTHYSSQPPAGAKASKVDTLSPQAPKAPDAANERARKELDQLRRASDERRRLEELEEARRAGEQRAADARAQRCGRSTQQLTVLTTGGPVYRYNERGERVYLDDSLRDSEIARARLEMQQNCSEVDLTRAAEEARRFDARQKAKALCESRRQRLAEVLRPEFRAGDTEIQQAKDAVARTCGPQS